MTLLGLGYILNKQGKAVKPVIANSISPAQVPTANHVYSSNMMDMVKQTEKAKADDSFTRSLKKLESGHVVNRDKSVYIKSLSGEKIAASNFKHNNMTPFFKGSVKQNFNVDGNKNIMERFMGSSDDSVQLKKKERQPLFAVQKDVGNCYGNSVKTDYLVDRIVAPKVQNNIKPIPEVRVGPGLGQGYTSHPTGGFQQFDVQTYALPKTVDDLRVKNKPKVTFDARTVDGQKGSMRGQVAPFKKNRVTTFYENSSDRYFVTTGASLKETMHGKYDPKYTNRLDTTKEYTGAAFDYQTQSAMARSTKIRETDRVPVNNFEPSAPNLTGVGKADKTDYGKGNILIYANERDTTTTSTYQGNLTSLVKAIVAPIEDMLKISKKEYTVNNPRPYGELQPQIPSKQPVMDPNNVMRTTIKETTIHDTQPANFKGPNKITVYDPNDVARTTIKQTTINTDSGLNLKGPSRITVYDPNDIARTTIKETNVHDADRLNLKGHVRTTVYDPNNVAKTTIKETLLHNAEYVNLKADRTANAVYVDENAKMTVRETLKDVDTHLNMNAGRKGKAYDPDGITKTTIRETTLDADRDGNIDGLQKHNAGYTEEVYDMKTTQKEMYSDNDYYGQPATTDHNGYQIADIDLPVTQKEIISDAEYYGSTVDQSSFKQMSYDDMYNAVIDELKEGTLMNREPTQQSVKLAAGGEKFNVDMRKVECDNFEERAFQNIDRVTNELSAIDIEGVTRSRFNVEESNRLDTGILDALKDNPYAHRFA